MRKYQVIPEGTRWTIGEFDEGYQAFITNDGICNYYFWDTREEAEAAAEAYAHELARFAPHGEASPRFSLTLLGMGPDGHIASLFPGRTEILEAQQVTLAIQDSPKPPPTRVAPLAGVHSTPSGSTGQNSWVGRVTCTMSLVRFPITPNAVTSTTMVP